MKIAGELTHPFSQVIRAKRKSLRHSLDSFAKLAGISKVQLWEMEKGTSFNPRMRTLIGISSASGIAVSRLAALAAIQIRLHPETSQ